MAEWINDPTLQAGEEVVAAVRTAVGTAFAWVPGETELEALARFCGDSFVLIDGALYTKTASAGYEPVPGLGSTVIVFKPFTTGGPAIQWLHPRDFAQGYAVTPTDETSLQLVDHAAQEVARHVATIAELESKTDHLESTVLELMAEVNQWRMGILTTDVPAEIAQPTPADDHVESPAGEQAS